jgi:hypothetical protein
MESQISVLGEDISALAGERDIRATNTLVRTLEKVLELEHKERKQRHLRQRQNRKLDDSERNELARRLVALQDQPAPMDGFTEAPSSDSDFERLAHVGAVGPTST